MPETPPPRTRSEPREVVELKQLKTAHPELASAIDMQVALLDMQRRVQSRVPLPWIQVDAAWLKSQHAAGRPVVRFSDIPIEWSDFRLTLRQTADILRRFDALEAADYDAIVGLGRDNRLEAIVAQWYDATSGVNGADPRNRLPPDAPAALDQVLVLAIRPFLARCAEVLMQRADLPSSRLGHCPYCGWEPDLAVITPAANRLLICGRCLAHWAFDGFTCPFCLNDERGQITSFASRDGRYRVYACDVCRRYLKAFDGRHAPRAVMIAVDTIATLPLDAAAIQRGYVG